MDAVFSHCVLQKKGEGDPLIWTTAGGLALSFGHTTGAVQITVVGASTHALQLN